MLSTKDCMPWLKEQWNHGHGVTCLQVCFERPLCTVCGFCLPHTGVIGPVLEGMDLTWPPSQGVLYWVIASFKHALTSQWPDAIVARLRELCALSILFKVVSDALTNQAPGHLTVLAGWCHSKCGPIRCFDLHCSGHLVGILHCWLQGLPGL